MKLQGQSIRLFIIESLKNLKTAELSNWVGKAYIGERKHSQLIQKLDELNNKPGVYLLLSENDDETRLYIGEADNVTDRINQHRQDKDKDWWDKFVVFVSSGSFNKAHVRYLEKELYLLAKENLTTINLENATSPPGSNLPNYDIADMDIFLKNMIFVLNNLGIIDFAKVSTEGKESSLENKNIFYLTLANSNLKSKLIIDGSGYKVLTDSFFDAEVRDSFKDYHYNKLRTKLINEKAIVFDEEKQIYVATEDIPFKSPSAAACVIRCRPSNGRKEWKLQNGKTLDEFEAENI